MPAQKVDGRKPIGGSAYVGPKKAGGSDPGKIFTDAFSNFIKGFNIGPKPGAMASNQYVKDHGIGSVNRRTRGK